MKQLFTFFLAAGISFSGYCQKDTTVPILSHIDLGDGIISASPTIMWMKSPTCFTFVIDGNELTFCDDSTIYIKGDSAKAIRFFYDRIFSMSERLNAMQSVLQMLTLKQMADNAHNKEFSTAVKEYFYLEKKEELFWKHFNQPKSH